MNFKNKKGFFVIDDFVALIVLGTAFIVVFFLPFVLLTIHINNVIQFEDKYNTADLALLSLLSMTHNGVPVQQIISEHITYNNPQDISFVNDALNKIIPSKCFQLTTNPPAQTTVPKYSLIIKPTIIGDCTPDTSSTVSLVVPYNPKGVTQNLELSIS